MVRRSTRGDALAGIGPAGWCALSLVCLALSGCGPAGMMSGTPPAPAPTLPTTADLVFALPDFPDAALDITMDVADAQTLAPLVSDSFPGQVLPFTASYVLPPVAISVTITLTVHLNSSAALRAGTNSGGGAMTLTDPLASFYFFFKPLFVVDNPVAPSVFAAVQAIADNTNLTLASAFPNGPYYLFQRKQVIGQLSRRFVGTDSRAVLVTDDTQSTETFTTQF